MIDYQLDLVRRIATTRVSGRVRFAELANHLHRLLRDPDFKVNFDAIIVAEDGAAVLSPSAVASFAPLLRAWASRRRGVRWAFVLPTVEAKQFAERALQEVRMVSVTARCFSSISEADAWLLESRAGGARVLAS